MTTDWTRFVKSQTEDISNIEIRFDDVCELIERAKPGATYERRGLTFHSGPQPLRRVQTGARDAAQTWLTVWQIVIGAVELGVDSPLVSADRRLS